MAIETTSQLQIGDAVLAVCPNSMTKEIYRVYKFIDGFDDRVMLKICKQSLSPLSELNKISDDYASEYKLSEIEVVKMLHIVDNETLHYCEAKSFDYYARKKLCQHSISTSIFESKEDAFDYIITQSDARHTYHQEQSFVYHNLHTIFTKLRQDEQ